MFVKCRGSQRREVGILRAWCEDHDGAAGKIGSLWLDAVQAHAKGILEQHAAIHGTAGESSDLSTNAAHLGELVDAFSLDDSAIKVETHNGNLLPQSSHLVRHLH